MLDELDKKLYGSTLQNVYGPYEQTYERRLNVVLYYKGGIKETRSYPKYLMERSLGRLLVANETVDHIDKNPLNNELNNLRILSREENARDGRSYKQGKCLVCEQEFTKKRKEQVICSNACRYEHRRRVGMK